MASVDFKKLHGSAEMKRILRHCDKGMRLADGHRNPDIDKTLTNKNTQLPNRDYAEVCSVYAARMKFLDAQPKANHKPDRVTCFALEIPAPNNMRDMDKPKWFSRVYELICDQYDARNILQFYVHYDEVHIYTHADSGKELVSRVHAHCLVIPENEGKLNGKWFSCRMNMINLNNSIQKMTMDDFALEFMNGSKIGSSKRVEQLKRESEAKKYELLIKAKNKELDDIQDKITATQSEIDKDSEIWQLGLDAYNKLHENTKGN